VKATIEGVVHAFRFDNLRRRLPAATRIGGAEVDADDLAHGAHFLFSAAGRPVLSAPEWIREIAGPLVGP
jgi:hypothetical protein